MAKKKKRRSAQPSKSATNNEEPRRAKPGKERASRRQRELQKRQAARQRQLSWIIGIGFLVLTLIGFGIYRSATAPEVGDAVAASNRIGSENAPVQIVEFGDFGCPACRTVHNLGIVDQIMERYGEQVSFTFRHYPIITRQSPLAAEASQCAAAQGAFWAWHDYMYEVVPPGNLAEPDLQLHASALGLNRGEFDRCLADRDYQEQVLLDQRAAVSAGARGTPSFYINGDPTSPDVNLMSAQIDAILGN